LSPKMPGIRDGETNGKWVRCIHRPAISDAEHFAIAAQSERSESGSERKREMNHSRENDGNPELKRETDTFIRDELSSETVVPPNAEIGEEERSSSGSELGVYNDEGPFEDDDGDEASIPWETLPEMAIIIANEYIM